MLGNESHLTNLEVTLDATNDPRGGVESVAKKIPCPCALPYPVTCFSHLLSLHVDMIQSPLKSAIHGIDMEIVQALCRSRELLDIDSNFAWGHIMRET